jgi:nucleoside-diphosphate-sugar epimerase
MVRDEAKARASPWCVDTTITQHDIASRSESISHRIGHIDAVVHLAWPGLPNYRDRDHFEKHLPDSYHFLKELITAGCKRVLVTGTCFEYGMQNGCLDETHGTNPTNPYGLAKDCLRRFLERLQDGSSFDLTWTRLFYVYGEGQNSKSLLSQLKNAVTGGASVFPMSGGEQLRDFLPIEEAATSIADLIELNFNVGQVNICSGSPTSVRKLVETWLVNNNKSIELQLGHYPYPDFEPMAFWGSRDKLDQLLRSPRST